MKNKKRKQLSSGEKMHMELYYLTHYEELIAEANKPDEIKRLRNEAVSKLLSLKTEGALSAARGFGYNPLDYLQGNQKMHDGADELMQGDLASIVGFVGGIIDNGAGAFHSRIKKAISRVRRYGRDYKILR